MRKLVAIWLIIAVLPAACNRQQQQQQQQQQQASVSAVGVAYAPAPDTVVIHDTILQYEYVADSTYANEIREHYEQSLLGYLRELVKMDSLVTLLWDGISMLIGENQIVNEKAEHLQAEVAGLQQHLSSMITPTPSYTEISLNDEPAAKTKSRRTHAQWLLEQPRTIYTVGVDDDAVGEIEVTGSSVHNNEMYLAVEIGGESAGEVSAYMNDAQIPYQYITQKERVFVCTLPKLAGTIKLRFVVGGWSCVVKTNVKNLL